MMRIEILVHPHLEEVGADGAGEALGDVEAVEGNDPALAGLDPEQGRVIRILRHGKDPGCIGFQQDVGGNLGCVIRRMAHAEFLPRNRGGVQ